MLWRKCDCLITHNLAIKNHHGHDVGTLAKYFAAIFPLSVALLIVGTSSANSIKASIQVWAEPYFVLFGSTKRQKISRERRMMIFILILLICML